MENASKALIMAGGVLIAILLLTLFSYLFSKMASSTSSVYDDLQKHEIDEFNQRFLNFEGRNDLTAQDVATLINLAQDSGKDARVSSKVRISLGGTDITSKDSNVWLQENGNSSTKYKCTVGIDPNTSLVNIVQLE